MAKGFTPVAQLVVLAGVILADTSLVVAVQSLSITLPTAAFPPSPALCLVSIPFYQWHQHPCPAQLHLPPQAQGLCSSHVIGPYFQLSWALCNTHKLVATTVIRWILQWNQPCPVQALPWNHLLSLLPQPLHHTLVDGYCQVVSSDGKCFGLKVPCCSWTGRHLRLLQVLISRSCTCRYNMIRLQSYEIAGFKRSTDGGSGKKEGSASKSCSIHTNHCAQAGSYWLLHRIWALHQN